jgi:heme exporter protein A
MNPRSPDPILLEQVSKNFGSFVALEQVSLSLSQGRFALLAGSNGAGKSTLLRLLAGLCKPSSGRVLIQGADPGRTPTVRAAIGLLSHQTLLYDDLTARENLLFAARLYDLSDRQERVSQALVRAGLEARQQHRVRTFSRGMKQRLALARATLHRPSILLFDEPYTGLDQRASDALNRQLNELAAEGCTSLLVTHRLDTAVQLIDHLFILKRGRICHDEPWSSRDISELHAVYEQHLEENL